MLRTWNLVGALILIGCLTFFHQAYSFSQATIKNKTFISIVHSEDALIGISHDPEVTIDASESEPKHIQAFVTNRLGKPISIQVSDYNGNVLTEDYPSIPAQGITREILIPITASHDTTTKLVFEASWEDGHAEIISDDIVIHFLEAVVEATPVSRGSGGGSLSSPISSGDTAATEESKPPTDNEIVNDNKQVEVKEDQEPNGAKDETEVGEQEDTINQESDSQEGSSASNQGSASQEENSINTQESESADSMPSSSDNESSEASATSSGESESAD